MPNTSATGGPLLPAPAPAPLEGQALYRVLQQWLVGITGLDGALVRPRYQAQPANIPTAGVVWASIGIQERTSQPFVYYTHDSADPGQDLMQRQQTLLVLASFYGLGYDGRADELADLFRDGSMVPQNNEILLASGMLVAHSGDPVAVPSLLAERWLRRVDVPVAVNRQIDRSYPILNVDDIAGTIETDEGLDPIPFVVEP